MEETSVNMEESTLFIMGKTGNGKSSLGNKILGRPEFSVASSVATTTTRVHQAVGVRFGERIQVIDTPDPVNLDLSDTAIKDEVTRWKSLATGLFAILLAVRCDMRYTAEAYDIYSKIKAAWGDKSFQEHLVVTFTFGDRQHRDLAAELRTVGWQLRSVLKDAGNRYVVFTNKAHENERQVQRLLAVLHELERQPTRLPVHFKWLLFLLVALVVFAALWFGVPWPSNMLEVFLFLAFVVVGTAALCVFLKIPRNILNLGMFLNLIFRTIHI